MAGDMQLKLQLNLDSKQYTAALLAAGQQVQQFSGQLQTADTAAQAMANALRAAATAAQAQQAAGVAMLAALRDQVATTGKSTEELLRYRAAQAGVAAEAAPLILQLQNQRAAQQIAAEAARAEEAAQRANAAAKQQAAAAQESFLAGLRDQAALQGKSQTEAMRYRAAQLGVAEGAEQYIRALEQGAGAHVKGAMSAKEHAMAMRMLPMQMTDVVTSLASGMPIWMVAIQQGGQIKDSFHGVGNALRAMLGAITPTVAGIGLLAGAAGLAAAAYYRGSKEQDAFAQSIITTGNASGVTVSQLRAYAQAIDGVVGTQAQAAEGLSAFTAAGVRGGDQLQQYTQTTIEWERATGQAVGKTAEQFASLQKDPLTAVIKLNDGTNFLTLSVYEQIKALAGQGKSAEASRVAMDALDAAMRERSKAIEGNLGYIERAWRGITGAAKEAWDAMLNVGRGTTDQQNLDQLRQNLARLEERNATLGIKPGKQTDDLRAQVKALEDKIAAENASADATARGNVQLQARIEWDKAGEKFLGKQARMEGELTKARAEGAAAGATAAEIERRLAAIRESYKESKGAGGITVSDAQLANLQGQLQAARLYGEQLATLGAGASQLNAGERESLEIGAQLARVTDAKTIARLQEKQAIADALGVQLRSNAGLEQSFKAHQALIDATAQDADALNQRAVAQEAANQVFGKGRTAIEEMTLAELQKQMAEAQGSDRFDPNYIASLELKIAAQKRWVGALQGADYKAAEQHVNELLRGAQELAKAYEDEQALSGLTALEREKIVAQRQVELKYAKELAAIDKTALTDAEKQALRDKAHEARRIEGAAAVAKAEQQHMARAADEINRSLTDALMRGFESGKDFAQNLADTTVNLFKTMVLRPTISAIMTPVSLVINGVVQQGMNAVGLGGGAGGSGGAMGMLSMGKDIYSAITGGFGALSGQVATYLQSGMNLMSGSGGMISQGPIQVGGFAQGAGAAAGTLAGVAGGVYGGRLVSGGYSAFGGSSGNSAVNTGTAIGAAVGSIFPVIGTAVGALVGGLIGGAVNRLFGHKLKDSGVEGDFGGATGFEGRQFEFYKGGWFRSDKTKYQDLDEETRAALADTFNTMRSGAKEMAGVLGLGTEAIDGFTAHVKVSLKGLSAEEADKRLKEEFDKIAESLASTTLGTEDYTRSGETAVQTLTRLSGSLVAVNDVFDHLGVTLLSASLAGGDLASGLIDAMGGMEQFQSTLQGYYQSYYSQTEQLSNAARTMGKGFDAMGVAMPRSRQELRGMITAQLEAGESGQELAASLLNASANFGSFADSLMSLSGITTDTIKGIFSTILDEAGSAQEAEQMATDAFGVMIMDSMQNAMLSGLSDMVMNSLVAPMMESMLAGAVTGSTALASGGATAAVAMAQGGAYAGAANAGGGAAAADSMAQGGASAGASMASGGAAAGGVVGSFLDHAKVYLGNFTAVMSDPEVQAAMAELGKTFGSTAGSLYSFSGGGGGGAKSFNGGGGGGGGAGAGGAASEADKLADALKRLGETMGDEVSRLRGLMVDDSSQSQAVLLARFATSTAAARAGDLQAAELLPELSKAIEAATAASAFSAVELARMRGWLAGSLEETAQLAGVKLPAFAVGTNYVPRDMLALIHEGEAIVPKAYNPAAHGAGAEGEAPVQALQMSFDRFAGAQLESSLNAQRILLRAVRVLEKWEAAGMPQPRSENWSPV